MSGRRSSGQRPAFVPQSLGGNRPCLGSHEGKPLYRTARPLPLEVNLIPGIECSEARNIDLAGVHPAADRSLRTLEDTPTVLTVPHSHNTS